MNGRGLKLSQSPEESPQQQRTPQSNRGTLRGTKIVGNAISQSVDSPELQRDNKTNSKQDEGVSMPLDLVDLAKVTNDLIKEEKLRHNVFGESEQNIRQSPTSSSSR